MSGIAEVLLNLGYTISGWNVTLTISCPARVSSTKPMIDAIDVPLTSCTRKPIVGGTAMRNACGRMT